MNMHEKMSLEGKNILITGGRSGLGFAMATCVALAGGFPIIVGSSSTEVMEEAAAKLPQGAGYHFDITEHDKAKEFVAMLLERYGHIDGLINNAGVHCKKPFEQTEISDYQRIFDVHLLGSIALTQAVVPNMREQKKGSVIFISSMSGMLGLTQVSAYSTAKTGMFGLVHALTAELACDGIRVNAISPGFIETPMFHEIVDNDLPRQQKILGHTPMQAYGDPMDIGWAAVYLCSDGARFVTGINLPVDGGFSIGF